MQTGADIFVDGTRSVKLVDARSNRKFITVWAGDSDLWVGPREVQPGTIRNKVPAKGHAEFATTEDMWAIRAVNTSGKCGYTEEINRG